jgi:hypothetical protein
LRYESESAFSGSALPPFFSEHPAWRDRRYGWDAMKRRVLLSIYGRRGIVRDEGTGVGGKVIVLHTGMIKYSFNHI